MSLTRKSADPIYVVYVVRGLFFLFVFMIQFFNRSDDAKWEAQQAIRLFVHYCANKVATKGKRKL